MNVKKIAAVLCFAGLACSLSAQTIFTYGTHAVSKDEFLQAYNKNPDTTGNKKEKLRQYLDLYVNFRLKLQAAYDEKADSNPDLKAEADNFRNQLAENFINQQADISRLMHEAFLRSQKDILLQQIFVQIPSTGDTAAAYAQISKAYDELKGGKSFDEVTLQYSSDPAIKQSKGMIGYVTVFTLSYAAETVVYSLHPGNFSPIYKSAAGYRIFKNVSERPAAGRRKIQQLLFPVLPYFTDQQKELARREADSVHTLLQTGTSFSSMLPAFGHNYQDDQQANDVEVQVGEYNGDFENEVYSLKKPGAFTQPFQTEYGYNIVKLVEIIPVPADENDVMNAAYLQAEIQKDGRLNVAKNNLIQKWFGLTHFKKEVYNQQDLWNYTDSALNTEDQFPALYKGLKPSTVLFQFEKKQVTISDWINYLRFMQTASGNPSQDQYEKFMNDFINTSCSSYYRENIEDFNPSIKEQMKEFNDANLLFYVMDKHVWTKASEDSAGLKDFYSQHAAQYVWKSSITALVISGPDKSVIDDVAAKIKANPSDWRNIVGKYDNSIYADSSRFEADQLPVKQPIKMEKDFQSQPEANETGDAYTFIHILDVYPKPVQRSFDDSRGLVINDYQQQLEQQWLNDLKKTYPVKINDAIFASIQ